VVQSQGGKRLSARRNKAVKRAVGRARMYSRELKGESCQERERISNNCENLRL
jgi:hypothetical protein